MGKSAVGQLAVPSNSQTGALYPNIGKLCNFFYAGIHFPDVGKTTGAVGSRDAFQLEQSTSRLTSQKSHGMVARMGYSKWN